MHGQTVGGEGRAPTALILEPARDLCEQVHECIVDFARYFAEPSLEAALLVGGVDPGAQLKRLRAGADIVSGTPGEMQHRSSSASEIPRASWLRRAAYRLPDGSPALTAVRLRILTSTTSLLQAACGIW